MTLNIFFISITIKKREVDLQAAANNELADKLYEQNRNRQASMLRMM